jgi:hypothetical protein
MRRSEVVMYRRHAMMCDRGSDVEVQLIRNRPARPPEMPCLMMAPCPPGRHELELGRQASRAIIILSHMSRSTDAHERALCSGNTCLSSLVSLVTLGRIIVLQLVSQPRILMDIDGAVRVGG